MEIIKKYNLPFAYCGDGSLLIGYKNPDFYETNGKKICIEVANKVSFQHPEGWDRKRIEHFAKYGWRCLVFWQNPKTRDFELSEEEIVNKIKDVLNGKS
jgi:very-short-patch-repair endonuclease